MATQATLSTVHAISSAPRITTRVIQPVTFTPVQQTKPPSNFDLFMNSVGGISYSNVLPNILGAENFAELQKKITEKIPFLLVGFVAVLVMILSANAFLNDTGVK